MLKLIAEQLNNELLVFGALSYADRRGVTMLQPVGDIVRMMECSTPRLVAEFMQRSCERPEFRMDAEHAVTMKIGPIQFIFASEASPSTVQLSRREFVQGPTLKQMVTVLPQLATFEEIDFTVFAEPDGPVH